MSLLTVPKTVVGGSLKLARVPLDVARSAVGGLRTPSPAEKERERAERDRKSVV